MFIAGTAFVVCLSLFPILFLYVNVFIFLFFFFFYNFYKKSTCNADFRYHEEYLIGVGVWKSLVLTEKLSLRLISVYNYGCELFFFVFI